jgi:hypothetical protein
VLTVPSERPKSATKFAQTVPDIRQALPLRAGSIYFFGGKATVLYPVKNIQQQILRTRYLNLSCFFFLEQPELKLRQGFESSTLDCHQPGGAIYTQPTALWQWTAHAPADQPVMVRGSYGRRNGECQPVEESRDPAERVRCARENRRVLRVR